MQTIGFNLKAFNLNQKALLLLQLYINSHQIESENASDWKPSIEVLRKAVSQNYVDFFERVPIKVDFNSENETGKLYDQYCNNTFTFAKAYKMIW